MAGLYHLAILVPTRAALGQALLRLERHGVRLTGAADHKVSEATYLDDPEGNGIEIYRDRDRASWLHDGRIAMGNTPLDLKGILAEGQASGPASTMASGTVLGHMHLETQDLPATRDFYVARLGFDLILDWRQALFMSVGGYHHHLGANIWEGRSRPRRPGERLLGLRHYTMLLHDADAVTRAGDALGTARLEDGAAAARRPVGNRGANRGLTAGCQRLGPDLRERGARRERLGVDPNLDQRGTLLRLRLGEGRPRSRPCASRSRRRRHRPVPAPRSRG